VEWRWLGGSVGRLDMTWVDGLSAMELEVPSLHLLEFLGGRCWLEVYWRERAMLIYSGSSDHGRYDGREEWGRIDEEGVYPEYYFLVAPYG
jgi:hypothetical protein